MGLIYHRPLGENFSSAEACERFREGVLMLALTRTDVDFEWKQE